MVDEYSLSRRQFLASGGALRTQLGQEFFPGAEIGQTGPEELALYTTAAGGWVVGSAGVTKAADMYQELKGEPEYTSVLGELGKAREFLEETKPELSEETLEE